MRASRRSQPYRRGSKFRQNGPALKAMLRGRTAYGKNPIDRKRALQKKMARKRRVRRRY